RRTGPRVALRRWTETAAVRTGISRDRVSRPRAAAFALAASRPTSEAPLQQRWRRQSRDDLRLRNRRSTTTFTGSHRNARCGAKWLNRWCAGGLIAGLLGLACARQIIGH